MYNFSESSMHNTRIVLPVASTIAQAEICLGCWSISQPDTLGLRRGYSDGKEATRPDFDEDCIRIGEFPCYSHYAERLARLKQAPIF